MRYWILLGGAMLATSAQASVQVRGVSLRADANGWRVDVKATGKTAYTVRTLGEPERLIIDVPDAVLTVDSRITASAPAGAPALRYSQFTRDPDMVRVVVDLPGASRWREISAAPAMNIAVALSNAPSGSAAATRRTAKARREGPIVISARDLEHQMRVVRVLPKKAAPAPRKRAIRTATRSAVTSRNGFVDRSDIAAALSALPAVGAAPAPVTPSWTPEEAVALINGSDAPEPLRRRLIDIVSDPAIQTSHYVWGAESPGQFDCSGLAMYIYSGLDLKLPRTSIKQSDFGAPVEKADLRAGDLVFFVTHGNKVSHVGIYLGGGKFLHAANPKSNLQITSLDSTYYSTRFAGARRVFGADASLAVGG
jgi:cell wall-associated NlpC family hydrolase